MSLIQLILTLIGIAGFSLGFWDVYQSKLKEEVVQAKISPFSVIDQISKAKDYFSRTSRSEHYTIGNGPGASYPHFSEALFDPFDAKTNEEQVITVRTENLEPVKFVSVIFKTDNGSTAIHLEPKDEGESSAIWSGSWKVTDTHDKIYIATLKAVSTHYRSSIDLHFK